MAQIPDRRSCPLGCPSPLGSVRMAPLCKLWACYLCLSCARLWFEESGGSFQVLTHDERERKLEELKAPGAVDNRVKWSWNWGSVSNGAED